MVNKLFNYGLERDVVAVNPCHGVRPPGIERQRDRVLHQDEIRAVWHALESESLAIRAIFRLRLLTLQRGVEVASMKWADLDLLTGWWTIPAAGSKNALLHRVPLSPQALKILKELQEASEEKRIKHLKRYGSAGAKARASAWVFPVVHVRSWCGLGGW